MHVIFVSQCHHKGIARTARVLDGFAMRHGDRTWMTPITMDGLDAVRNRLRQTATRQMAVACYINDGRHGMRLAWVVGRKDVFNDKGEVAVASRAMKSTKIRRPEMPWAIRLACLLARASGYVHDWGKYFEMFQNKLRALLPLADPVRHEWISLHLLMQCLNEAIDAPLQLAWDGKSSIEKICSFEDFSKYTNLKSGLLDEKAVFLYLTATHHRLPQDKGNRNGWTDVLDESTYVVEGGHSHALLKPAAKPSTQILSVAHQTLKRIHAMTQDHGPGSADFWRAVSIVARMSLILADHSVSGVFMADAQGHGSSMQSQPGFAFANSVIDDDGVRRMNQSLEWHLLHVGDEAGRMAARMMSFDPDGVSMRVREKLRSEAANTNDRSRFSWQGRNAQLLRTLQSKEKIPTLVFNIAGTGCGKTRGNVILLDALRDGETLRFATGLNLRTLTLQTRDAYSHQMGMDSNDMACVIGSRIAKRLHESREINAAMGASKKSSHLFEDEDGNDSEDYFDVIGDADEPPMWLEGFLSKKAKMRPVIMSPALVCTIDFLVNAGDPTQQGNYALVMLRLMKSDLIVDEIDSYDPQALSAVMRLVTSAAMWGRHVIASSATLSEPVANALQQAFDLGLRMSYELGYIKSKVGRYVLIDDKNEASVLEDESESDFKAC